MEDLTQGIDKAITRGTDHTPIMDPDIADITADDSPVLVHTAKEAVALEGTPHALLLATTAAHATLQQMDVPITPCAMIPLLIVTPHVVLAISAKGVTHATPWIRASLIPAAPTMQHKILSSGR